MFEQPQEDRPTEKPRRRSNTRDALINKILEAAENIFALKGYSGATIEAIAEQSDLSKQNMLYYFSSKEVLYQAVLRKILHLWMESLNLLDQQGENPATMLSNYIRGKLEISRTMPNGSKVFANEIINGAPHIKEYLKDNLIPVLEEDVKLVRNWIAQGKMDDVDPYHLFFVIWASTQTYADFSAQIQLALDKPSLDSGDFKAAGDFLTHTLLKGVGLTLDNEHN
ncbi:TetR/AcrR family transcriptional regulator [Thalassotalea piscium]|uniref:TetR/AcrR family transcriptional regulator n=1 Tax=Thalassotalea piscium TaxID=1230533 RepID=A0A7X0NIZ5_9GAMM|nr:TetR/AcrR family transcriptional regulator [Thalassotalea piscium]MBB6544332.1 TetR/AcrR family transcriptional regulator [Thalassotalea piscium]